jgi:uncharacterized membrane protein YgcG
VSNSAAPPSAMRRDIAAIAALLAALLGVLVVLALSGVFDGEDPARVGAGVAGGVVASGPNSSTLWSTSAVGADDRKRDRRDDEETRESPALAVDPTPVESGGADAAVPVVDTGQPGPSAPPPAPGVAQGGAAQLQAAPDPQTTTENAGQAAAAVPGGEVQEQAEQAPAEGNSGSGSSGSGSSGSGSSGSGSSGSGSSGSG